MKRIALTAALSSALTVGLIQSLSAVPGVSRSVVLENVRVEVTQRTIAPGGVREPHIRPADQVIVFLDDATYDRIDPATGQKVTRQRKAGEVIWHGRGELAPKLVNAGKNPFRSLVIALK